MGQSSNVSKLWCKSLDYSGFTPDWFNDSEKSIKSSNCSIAAVCLNLDREIQGVINTKKQTLFNDTFTFFAISFVCKRRRHKSQIIRLTFNAKYQLSSSERTLSSISFSRKTVYSNLEEHFPVKPKNCGLL